MFEKQKYYDLQPLLDTQCNWMILYGMRSNGKSYAVKKYVIKRAYEEGRGFVYLRRWAEDIKEKEVASYFDDMPISQLTDGEFVGISAHRGYFYFYSIGPDDLPKRDNKPIGRYCALTLYERYKSQVFQDIDSIIYEEFLTSRIYLGSNEFPEPNILQNFVSTVFRLRDGKIFLIGNTVSRVCPYVDCWNLQRFLKQQPGSIDIYHLHGENGVVDIAVENCEVVETKSKMFFGLASKQIIKGEWDVEDLPRLKKPYEYYEMLYEAAFRAGGFKFIMQLLFDGETGGSFVYVYPGTKDRKISRVITPDFDTDPMISNGFNGKISAEVMMAQRIREGKICYSDNLTGTDFRQCMQKYDFRKVV